MGWRALAAVLTLAGVGCLLAWANQPAPAASEPHSSTSSTTTAPTHSPERAAAVTGAPVRLRIPAIEVSTTLLRLGLNADSTVEVPDDPDLAGWYHLGPRPGETGSSVILGHVDSLEGPAVFARLAGLRRGQHVLVATRTGETNVFVVTAVETYPNADFPAQRVYARSDGRFLNLVTCGGAYDAAQGGYQANVVVYTRLLIAGKEGA